MSYLLWATGYEAFTWQLLNALHQPEKLQKFRLLFTPVRFFAARWLLLGGVAGYLILLALLLRNIQAVSVFFHRQALEARQVVAGFFSPLYALTRRERLWLVVVFGIWLAARLYFVSAFPFHIDERFSYLYFVSKGWGVSLAYYPNPNNHILYTLCCNAADIFLSDPRWVMKTPAFLIGTLFPVVFFLVLRQFFAFSVCFPATVVAMFNVPVFYYSVQGRGYGLLFLCLVVACGSLLKIAGAEREKFGWYATWVGASLAGLYAVPVFAYPLAGMVAAGAVFCLQKSRLAFFRFVAACGVVVGLTLLLYLPVFVFNGWYAVTGNSWVSGLSPEGYLSRFPGDLEKIAEEIWFDVPQSWVLVMLQSAICLYWLLNKKTAVQAGVSTQNLRQWAGLLLVVWWVLPVFLLVQRPVLYQRVFAWLWVFQAVWWGILLEKAVVFFRKDLVQTAFLLLFVVFQFTELYKTAHPAQPGFYESADAIAHFLYSRKADHLYFNSYEYSLCTRFLYETSGKRVQIQVGNAADSQRFNFLILEKKAKQPPTTGFEKIYEDTEAVIYTRLQR